jgi:hypothetical protein
MKRLYWTGISSQSRLEGIGPVQACIDPFGFVVDHKLFSDVAVALVIETEERNIAPMYARLKEAIQINEPLEPTADTHREYVVLCNITFAKGTGNQIHEVPAVPG